MDPSRSQGPEVTAVRDPETCPHREPSAVASGEAWCRLAGELSGLGEQGVPVGLDACGVCCRRPIPAPGRINSVIASLVGRAASRARDDGGLREWSPERFALLMRWLKRELVEVRPIRVAAAGGNGCPDPLPHRPSIGVAVLSRDAGPWVAKLVEIARSQTVTPREIVVICIGDDAGEAGHHGLASGVRPIRVADDGNDPLGPFRAAVEALHTEIVCFLGDGDVPPPDYLERGLPHFHDPSVALVYSDVEFCGEVGGRTFAPEFDPDMIERDPQIIHRGTLARRSSLLATDALRAVALPVRSADRVVWDRVLNGRWKAARQSAVFRTAIDPDGPPSGGLSAGPGYFDRATLSAAEVTIFTPLAGRTSLWGGYAGWLQAQTWPRDQCHLFLADTSGVPEFGRSVRQFLASCDYPDTRYACWTVEEQGLADRPRGEHLDAVRLACARIYHRMAGEITTRFVLIVEDDVIPPPGIIGRLLHAMDAGTVAVAAPYRARLHDAFVVWDDEGSNLEGGRGVESVGGSGFGCLLIRRGTLDRMRPPGEGDPADIDRAFGLRLRRDRRTFKVDWSQDCRHLAGPAGIETGASDLGPQG